MLECLKSKKDEIQSAAAILTVVIGVVGFGLTILQLSDAKNALKANNAYLIQKDARAVSESLDQNDNFVSAIQEGINDTNKEDFLDGLWVVLSFYRSVFRQAEADGISDDFAQYFSDEFCQFFMIESVTQGFEVLEKRNRTNSGHDEMIQKWCKND